MEKEQMAQRILDVARDMFVRDGYEAVTMRKIAAAIQHTPPVIYQHFKDKKALVSAIIHRDSQDLRANLEVCKNIKDPLERLVEMGRRIAAWGVAHPNHYRLMFVPPPELVEQEEEVRRAVALPAEQELLHALKVAIKEATKKKAFKREYRNPAIVGATLWGGIHGAIMLEIAMTDHDKALLGDVHMLFEERLKSMIHALLEGLLKR